MYVLCMNTSTDLEICIYVYICMYAQMYVDVPICVYICTSTYTMCHVCVYVYTNKLMKICKHTAKYTHIRCMCAYTDTLPQTYVATGERS